MIRYACGKNVNIHFIVDAKFMNPFVIFSSLNGIRATKWRYKELETNELSVEVATEEYQICHCPILWNQGKLPLPLKGSLWTIIKVMGSENQRCLGFILLKLWCYQEKFLRSNGIHLSRDRRQANPTRQRTITNFSIATIPHTPFPKSQHTMKDTRVKSYTALTKQPWTHQKQPYIYLVKMR